MVAIVHASGKALGAFIPIPDFVLWRSDPLERRTVPDSQRPGAQIPAEAAFFDNTSDCCYHLASRVRTQGDTTERSELRMNLAWQASLGLGVATADDTDAVDRFLLDAGRLSSSSYPDGYVPSPDPAMRSPLAWDLGYVPAPPGVSLPIGAMADYEVEARLIQVDDGGDGSPTYEVYGDASVFSDDHLGDARWQALFSEPWWSALDLPMVGMTTSVPTAPARSPVATVRASAAEPRLCLTTGDSRIMEDDTLADDVIVPSGVTSCLSPGTLVPGAATIVTFELRGPEGTWMRLTARVERSPAP